MLGGHKCVEHTDFKSQRPLFGSAGVRTPMHIDNVAQILSQFNGTKYAFMAGFPSTSFSRAMERRLGFLGAHELELGRNQTKFIAGCQLHPGEALYMPPWTVSVS